MPKISEGVKYITPIIFEGEPDNLIIAARAAKWLLARPTQRDAIVAYGEGSQEVVFYVKRNKASISVLQDTRAEVADAIGESK